jgi:hypothetical protein
VAEYFSYLTRGEADRETLRDVLNRLGVANGDEFVVMHRLHFEDSGRRLMYASVQAPPDEANARRGDPETSKAAASSVKNMNDSREAVLTVLQGYPGGLTDEELIAQYVHRSIRGQLPQQSESGIRSRRAELVAMDPPRVMDSGERRQTVLGRDSIVWTAWTTE